MAQSLPPSDSGVCQGNKRNNKTQKWRGHYRPPSDRGVCQGNRRVHSNSDGASLPARLGRDVVCVQAGLGGAVQN
jgi:hypothetical protein